LHPLDWIIVGGESGPNARPFDVSWAESVIRQCKATDTKVFVKQLGAKPACGRVGGDGDDCFEPVRLALANKKGGDMAEWPADLRVREFPAPGSSRRTVANSHRQGG